MKEFGVINFHDSSYSASVFDKEMETVGFVHKNLYNQVQLL